MNGLGVWARRAGGHLEFVLRVLMRWTAAVRGPSRRRRTTIKSEMQYRSARSVVMVGRKCCECLVGEWAGEGNMTNGNWERAGRNTGQRKAPDHTCTAQCAASEQNYSLYSIPSLGLNPPSRADHRGRQKLVDSGLRNDSIWSTGLVILYIARN